MNGRLPVENLSAARRSCRSFDRSPRTAPNDAPSPAAARRFADARRDAEPTAYPRVGPDAQPSMSEPFALRFEARLPSGRRPHPATVEFVNEKKIRQENRMPDRPSNGDRTRVLSRETNL
ncbi:MAG TPA: hypothetical protein DCQ98_22465 [Planctomycetaceae bacterium]|nr:hypothetical protein [Planctomycetaceae bacterium]